MRRKQAAEEKEEVDVVAEFRSQPDASSLASFPIRNINAPRLASQLGNSSTSGAEPA